MNVPDDVYFIYLFKLIWVYKLSIKYIWLNIILFHVCKEWSVDKYSYMRFFLSRYAFLFAPCADIGWWLQCYLISWFPTDFPTDFPNSISAYTRFVYVCTLSKAFTIILTDEYTFYIRVHIRKITFGKEDTRQKKEI